MWILSLLYFLTRLLFLRAYPVFYDSFEYSKIAGTINFSNFTQIITASHQPIHTFYFLTILLVKQVFFFLQSDVVLVLISFVFGYLTLLFWFRFVREYLSPKAASFACLLLLLFPYFFLANTNILYESELLFFQVASLYFFSKAVKHDNQAVYLRSSFVIFILLAGLLFGFSVSVFTGSLLILPIFLLILWQKRTSKILLCFAFLILLVLLVPLVIDLAVLKSPQIILAKYQPHFGDLVSSQGGIFVFVYRVLRNIIVQSAAILSPVGAIVLVSTIVVYHRSRVPRHFRVGGECFQLCAEAHGEKKPRHAKRDGELHSLNTYFLLLNTLLWFAPPLLLMQFWHSGLYGRLGLFIVFPASLFFSQIIIRNWQKILVFLILLILLIPHLLAQTQRPPIYRYYDLIKDIPDLAIVTSDTNRFLYQKNDLSVFVLGSGSTVGAVEIFIEDGLKNNKMVLIDSAGLNYPYFQFDGNPYHLLSKNQSGKAVFAPLTQKYRLKLFKTDTENPEIFFDQIEKLLF